MTIPEILAELETCKGVFPVQAVHAAVEQREAITPELLKILEAVADNPTEFALKERYKGHLFALFLLAQFREKRAYLPIIKLFSAPGETPYDLVGEVINESLPRIIASVYDGNPAPLAGLVERADVDEFVRSSALETFLVLEHTGQISRDEVVEYLRGLFHGKLERTESYLWEALMIAAVDLPAPELREEVRQAYEEGLADPWGLDVDESKDIFAERSPYGLANTELITDASEEMDEWVCFNPPEPWREPPPDVVFDHILANALASTLIGDAPDDPVPQPVVRDQPKIGRNEPCPCGSGKKYKKCCGKG
jgi:hypothetical protein